MNKINWHVWFRGMLKEFMLDTLSKPQYEIVEIYECPKTGFTKAVIKLSARHRIDKNICDIVTDDNFIEGFDKKTIRTLTYMATVEKLKPDYSVVVQKLGDEVDDYVFQIQHKKNKTTIKKTLSELIKDKMLLTKFNSIDANRIGYLAGIRETVREFRFKNEKC